MVLCGDGVYFSYLAHSCVHEALHVCVHQIDLTNPYALLFDKAFTASDRTKESGFDA